MAITLGLIGVNVIVFLIELSMRGDIDAFVRRWGLVPADFRDEPIAVAVTLVTSTFLHAGWFHLGANMIYLGVFGPPVERRLGPSKFAIVYLASGVIGSAMYLLAQPASATPAIGASGAIAGLIAARLVLFLQVVESAPTLLLLLVWLVTQVFSSVASLTTSTGIAWWAHLGGFASGCVLAPVLGTRKAMGK